MMTSISTLQAAAGRFLTSREVLAWEPDSLQRCTSLVRSFQQKALDPDGLQAALRAERSAPAIAPPPAKTMVVPLIGVVTPADSIFSFLGFGTSLRTFMQQVTAASSDPDVKAIVVLVDSPGGSVRLVPEAAALVRSVRTRKPVVAAVAGLNASAAYWITSGATAIEATPSALIGSIGVVTQRTSIARLLEREGIDIDIISAGKFKAESHPARPISDAERRYLQQEVDAVYAEFIQAIANGRQELPARIRDGYGEGRTVRADEALRAGMIDRLALVEDTLTRAASEPATLTGTRAARMIQQQQRDAQRAAHDGRAQISSYRRRLQMAARRSSSSPRQSGAGFDTLATRGMSGTPPPPPRIESHDRATETLRSTDTIRRRLRQALQSSATE